MYDLQSKNFMFTQILNNHQDDYYKLIIHLQYQWFGYFHDKV